MEPKTSIIDGGDHIYTRIGRYSVHTDMLAFYSQAYEGPPSNLKPLSGERFKIFYAHPDDRVVGHGGIVDCVLQLPQNPKHDIPSWITRDEENSSFELDGYTAGLTGKRIVTARHDIPINCRDAWMFGYRRGRAEQRDRIWRAIRNGLTDAGYENLLSWVKGQDGRRLDPLTARFEDFPSPMEWSAGLHVWLGKPDPRRIADYYPEYLQSALWRLVIRPRVLARDGYECWRCAYGASEVHHASYHPIVMAGLADEWLFSICRKCHEYIHCDDPSYGLQWRRLNARLNKRGLLRGRWKKRIDFGQNLPTQKQIAQWQASTAQGEVEMFRQGMQRVQEWLEIEQDWTLERARDEVGFNL
jgi:hypothetical protein